MRGLLKLAAAAALALSPSRGASRSADRHQVQPRRRPRHAQGQGRRVLQEARRGAHQGPGEDRALPELELYKDKEELEALQLGAVQMLAPSLAKFGPLGVKEFEVFDLPYIFDG